MEVEELVKVAGEGLVAEGGSRWKLRPKPGTGWLSSLRLLRPLLEPLCRWGRRKAGRCWDMVAVSCSGCIIVIVFTVIVIVIGTNVIIIITHHHNHKAVTFDNNDDDDDDDDADDAENKGNNNNDDDDK